MKIDRFSYNELAWPRWWNIIGRLRLWFWLRRIKRMMLTDGVVENTWLRTSADSGHIVTFRKLPDGRLHPVDEQLP